MAPATETETATARAPRRRWGRWLLMVLGALAALLLLALAWLHSDSGRRFVANQIAGLSFDNGLAIRIERIDGSIFGEMQLHGLSLRDPQGTFLLVPQATLDWRPLAYLRNHIDIRRLILPDARLFRLPQFKETPPSDGPWLPDLDIDVDALDLGRLQIDPAVTGKRHLLGLSGRVHIADGRAQLRANGRAIAARDVAGGDRLALTLDAVPQANRLTLDMTLDAPADGLAAALSGVAQPLSLTLKGKGDWAAWTGTMSGAVGADALADLAITARDGRFTLKGSARPGLLLANAGGDLLEPAVRVDLAVEARQRRIQLDGTLDNDNFSLGAKGLVDLGVNRFGDLALDVRLLEPGAITTNVRGDAIIARISLDGAFAAPDIAYRLDAGYLGFGATRIEGLSVSGSASLEQDQWLIPLQGRARRISGVAASVAPLLVNVRLDGDLAYANGRLLSDNLHLVSSGIDARAVVVADLNQALYTGALNGRVNGYQVDSVGIFNVQTDIDLEAAGAGTFRLGGRVRARSTRLLNDQVRRLLGGDAMIVADVGYDSNGVATMDRLVIEAPAFHLDGKNGRYAANGSLRFSARARSEQYGPMTLDVAGSIADPRLHFVAERPGLGMGVVNVEADVRGDKGRYSITATGGTDYGPFAADIAVATGAGPIHVDVRPGTRFAGVGLTGRIDQTPAGPFAGTLKAAGSGIDGVMRLSAFDGVQRAHIDATARNARLPGEIVLTADRAIVTADLILYDQPQLVADVQFAGTRLGTLYVAAARAQADYRNGAGQAKLLVEGRTRFPFRFAANAQLAPQLWRVAIDGRVNGIAVKTRTPMRILPRDGGYSLATSLISVGRGTLQLAGRYGDGLAVQSRLKDVDLALANPFVPGLGLGGTATGSLDFDQTSPDAFPTADARLVIAKFTRSGLTAMSEPVDIELVGRLEADGGNARALVRRRGAAIGRSHVNLRPLPPGAGGWVTRLLSAPLSGGVRYNGPADVLFSLAALPDQSLRGTIGLAADFSGLVRSPQLSGLVRAKDLIYENGQFGTRLTNMAVEGRFTNDRLDVETLSAKAGAGTVKASGFVSLSAQEGFPMQLGIDLANAQLATGQDLSAQASGTIKVVSGPDRASTVSGRISLPETHYKIVREGSAKVATLTGVRRKPVLARDRITGDAEPMKSLPSAWQLDVTVAADNKIYVTGMGIESEWAANLHFGGTSGAPIITGAVRLVRGTLGFAGHSFDLQDGRISFSGGDMTNPELTIVATGDIEDVAMTITMSGSAQNPQIAFSSTPALPQDELMARVLFGSSVGQLSAIQAVQLASSLNSLRGGSGGLNPLGILQSASGIDRIRILGSDEENDRGAALAVGQYITNDVYVEIITDARGYTATQLEVSLSRALSLLSEVSNFGTSSLGLRYRKNY